MSLDASSVKARGNVVIKGLSSAKSVMLANNAWITGTSKAAKPFKPTLTASLGICERYLLNNSGSAKGLALSLNPAAFGDSF